MLKQKRLSRSFILGALAAASAVNALENLASLLTSPDFQTVRILLFVLFGCASVVFTLMELRNI